MADLFFRFRHALRDDGRVVLAARGQAFAQRFQRWRQEKHGARIRPSRHDLLRALPVNAQDNVLARRQERINGCRRRAVGVMEDLRVFKEAVGVNHCLELRRFDEVVMHAIDFARSCCARGVRHAFDDVIQRPHRFGDEAGLAAPGRRRNNPQLTLHDELLTLAIGTWRVFFRRRHRRLNQKPPKGFFGGRW